jgi:RNA polymerase sigma factor (sigma-70 family)
MIDNKTLSDIYDRHHHELYVYICGFTRLPEVAEDFLHDAFVRLIRYSQKYPLDPGNIRAFLYRTARNICIDHARRNRKLDISPLNDNLESAGTDPQEDAELRELRRTVNSLVDDRDQVSRSVYLMRTELEMPYQEIAEALGISERTAKRKMSSMLEYLAESLEKAGFKLFMLILLSLLAILIVVYK